MPKIKVYIQGKDTSHDEWSPEYGYLDRITLLNHQGLRIKEEGKQIFYAPHQIKRIEVEDD